MMIRILSSILLLMSWSSFAKTKQENAAYKVVERLIGKKRIKTVRFKQIKKVEGCNVFETQASNGILTVRGSSAVAMSRGFYDYIKRNKYGIVSWSGTRLNLPKRWPSSAFHRVESPYKHHYNFNVVTYGYTMPYWDWKRWEKELDWMALHGFDMPLALVGTEAIAIRVWKKLGLSQEAIDRFYVGPAHLPWQRMGNVVNHDGPIPDSWHVGQVKLQHRVLKRMRALGMKPIAPAFAGFVPKEIQKLHPDVELHKAGWGGWPEQNKARLLMPTSPLFKKIGKMFINEWEAEFGKNKFYLADSFNEMDIPAPKNDKKKRYKILSKFGKALSDSIKAGNPDATWVMQGWMFGYQRYIWDPATLAALIKDVPDDKMLLLDLAVDYNKHFWKNGSNWDHHKGFYNKEWVYSTIPNMGGKTGWTGILDFYAQAGSEALASKNKGRLVGFGMAMEGFENNEVIYELLSDRGWQAEAHDLDAWLENYCINRYGAYPDELKQAWKLFRESCYGTFTDHPRFNWQFRPGGARGTVNTSEKFIKAVGLYNKCAKQFKGNKLFEADLIELTSASIGSKIQDLILEVPALEQYGDDAGRDKAVKQIDQLFIYMDKLLQSHPLHRLDYCLDFAKKHGTNAEETQYYESNAKRLLTVWGPPIEDYSARVWSGLVGDYYRQRWALYFESRKTGQAVNYPQWEAAWVSKKSFNKRKKFSDPVLAARKGFAKISSLKKFKFDASNAEVVARWAPADITTNWKKIDYRLNTDVLKDLKGFYFQYEKGKNRLDIQSVQVVLDGKVVAEKKHLGHTGIANSKNFYKLKVPKAAKANNSCVLRVVIKAEGGNDSHGKISIVKKK